MSSLLIAAERSVGGKITRSGLDTRNSRPPASTMVASGLGIPEFYGTNASERRLGSDRRFCTPGRIVTSIPTVGLDIPLPRIVRFGSMIPPPRIYTSMATTAPARSPMRVPAPSRRCVAAA
jgi:hypothetical protein